MSSSILHQSSWALSAGGKSIELFSAQHQTERPLLFIGGVHGDEPEGVELAQKFLLWLQKNNKPEFYSWLLIPCLNPDGYSKNERTNGNGVDLNRNFPSRDWSPESKAPRYFPGTHPGSEPEVQALVSLIQQKNPLAIIHFHSWKPCVVYTGAPGKALAEMIAHDTGYEAREDIGYPTPGSLGQYGWLEHQTPVICVEEQEHADLATIWPRFAPGLQGCLSRDRILSRIRE